MCVGGENRCPHACFHVADLGGEGLLGMGCVIYPYCGDLGVRVRGEVVE